MSELSSLRAELSRQERINRELRNELYELQLGVSRADSELTNFRNNVTNTLNNSNQRIVNAHSKILDAYEVQGEIDQMYVRFKHMELANKKIRECNNKKYYDFANYRTVRKLVQGIMDNMSVQMVSDDIIYKSVEKQHLQTPDYWLTCVLISAMAWRNDDKPLADRAMAEAVKLDKKNSAIFYMLFNIRVRREDAAVKWFRVYQECELKGSDERTFLMLFSLLSKTMDEIVDDHTKYEIYDFINKVIALNAQSNGFNEEDIIFQIKRYLSAMQVGDGLNLNLLKTCCDDYNRIAEVVSLAQNNKQILQFLMDVGNVSEIERNEYVNQFIDEEIEKPNGVELAVYDEIEYNETIIRCNGDVDRAKEIHKTEQQRRQKELNLIQEMILWIYGKGSSEVNGQIRKNMFVLTGGLQKKAINKYANDYRSKYTHQHPVTLGEYKTKADFTNFGGEENKIKAFYEQVKAEQLAAISDVPAYIAFAIAVAAGIGAVAWELTLFAGTAIGAIAGVCMLFLNKNRRNQIAHDCETNIKGKTEIMSKLFAEYRQMARIYEEYDAYQEQIAIELTKL